MIEQCEIKQMTVQERLEFIELLWNSIENADEHVTSPHWHGDILAVRRQRVEAGQGEFLTMAELRDSLKADS